jgi:hypothetical protein
MFPFLGPVEHQFKREIHPDGSNDLKEGASVLKIWQLTEYLSWAIDHPLQPYAGVSCMLFTKHMRPFS